MSEEQNKVRTSITVRKETLERIEQIKGVNRSRLFDEVMEDWLDDNDY